MTHSTLTAWWQHWSEEVAQRFDFRTQLLHLRAGWLQLQHARLQGRHARLQLRVARLQLKALMVQFRLLAIEARHHDLNLKQFGGVLPVLRSFEQAEDQVQRVFDVAHSAQPASAAAPVNASLS